MSKVVVRHIDGRTYVDINDTRVRGLRSVAIEQSVHDAKPRVLLELWPEYLEVELDDVDVVKRAAE